MNHSLFFSLQPSRPRRAGVTLVELMIALAILTIGVVGVMGSFQFIQKAIQSSKNRTLASNLAQEKMQILKQKVYYQVIPTSSPGHNTTDFAPESIDYDTDYFPPEDITEAGVTYTRYTLVQTAMEDSGRIVALSAGAPDTGMKLIIVTVVWSQGGTKRKLTMRNILSNPDTVMANVVFNGVVQTTSSLAINGALVQLVEMPGCNDTANSSGQYNINATPGTYTLMASANGYYPAMKSFIVAAGVTQPWDFQLRKIATGRIIGYPWLTDHLVISQVVGSTVDASVGFDQEYVEVFNPTTYTWTMNGEIGLKFRRSADSAENTILINSLHPAVTIPSNGYYLFANTGTVVAGGAALEADAVWSNGNSTSYFPYFSAQGNIIPVDGDDGLIPSGEGGGAIKLYRILDGTTLDMVGWDKNLHPAPFYEGAAIVQATGLSRNELYARFTSTADTGGVNWNFGPAYDSNNNSLDFYDYWASIIAPPHNSDSAEKTVISGTPAAGTVVSCTDGLSASTAAVLYSNPSPNAQSYAYFSLVDVATGSWTVLISSGVCGLERASVPIPDPGGSVYTFTSSTTLLTQSNTQGIISGRVLNVAGGPLIGITVNSPSAPNPAITGSPDGRYWLRVVPGVVNVTANPVVGGIATYVTASSNTISIDAGEVHGGVDFVLYQGGRVRGFVTRDGSHGLPGVAVAVFDANSIARDQQISGSDGYFTSVVLSTGYYVVQPAISALEASSPVSSTVTILTTALNPFSSTFTITGALGYITGTVTSGGQPIKTGVLIVVTTATLSGTPPSPPDINFAALTGPPYYLVSSMEDGTYRAELREGGLSGYKVYAYYPVPSGTGVTISTASVTGVSVTAGAVTTGVNFSW